MDKNSKIILFTGILFLFFSIIFTSLFVGNLVKYNESNNLTYDDLMYIECTVESVRESGNIEDGYQFYISVVEGKKVVRINNLLTENNVIEGLRKLKKGDHIYCYVKLSSSHYEVVQIKGDSMILSLEQYKQIMHKQSISGFIIFPIVFFLSTGIGIYSIIAVFKNKKQVQL